MRRPLCKHRATQIWPRRRSSRSFWKSTWQRFYNRGTVGLDFTQVQYYQGLNLVDATPSSFYPAVLPYYRYLSRGLETGLFSATELLDQVKILSELISRDSIANERTSPELRELIVILKELGIR